MNLSVGVLYDCQKFISLCHSRAFYLREVRKAFCARYDAAPIAAVLEMMQVCNWLEFAEDGRLSLTERGLKILSAHDEPAALRVQLMDFIELTKPTWSGRIPYGRDEMLRFVSDDVNQCFREARLSTGYDREVVAFWDRAAALSRGRNGDALLQIGREGETLSIEWEVARTGRTPVWKAVDSNLAGYDILSVVSRDDLTPLKIEVKAVKRKDERAFYLTRNEWTCASGFGAYALHLWILDGRSEPIVHSAEDLRQHVPLDQGDGEWQTVMVSVPTGA